MSAAKTLNTLIGAAVLAGGIAAAGYFIGQTLYNSRVALNTAEVKGLAERRVSADQAHWTIGYTVAGNRSADMAALYAESEAAKQEIMALLSDAGFTEAEIKPGVVNYINEEFRDENQLLVDSRRILVGEIEVQTDNVQGVEQGRAKLNTLIAKGLDINNQAPKYHFTKLNEIKPAMLKEATTNARLAANEFASNAGVTVGGIRSARQGGFIIRDVGAEYGDSRKIEKDVRVVTTVSFYLTE
ncbi:MAG: SIMPL domain-containing protein [Cellvibrionaceae bacterium]|nr:SIMPL domain-containing protein [Cellvibrionaceae bacterium]